MNFLAVVSPIFIFHVGYMGMNSKKWVKISFRSLLRRTSKHSKIESIVKMNSYQAANGNGKLC